MRAFLLAIALVVFTAGPAFAHTEFDPDEAAPGSTVTVTLNAADERDDANISKVELSGPTDVTVVMADPLAATEGWTGTVLDDRVEWSGPPTEGDQSFTITLGPLPDAAGTRLQFKLVETYDNGQVDRWIEDYPIDAAEPDMPGPVIDLVAGATDATTDTEADGSDTSTTLEIMPLESGDDTSEAAVAITADEVDDDDDASNTGVIVAVMAVGVIAIVAGIYFIRRRGSA